MAHTETHTVLLTKYAQRSLRDKVIESNMTTLIASVNTKSLAVKGWTIDTDATAVPTWWAQLPSDRPDAEYTYRAFLTVSYSSEKGQPGKLELAAILRTIYSRAIQPAFGKWTLTAVDGTEYIAPSEDDELGGNINIDLIGYAEVNIPDDWEGNFTHLFGLEAHVRRIKAALEAGVMSDWRNRFHCALVGPPGCGKSDICGTIKRILGEDSVMEFDATATTAAGAIKELAEREILPRVLVVEEIEKADEKALAFLLALMDLRGEIRKTTARATIQRDTKLFVIATVNNVELFERLQAGALASRFANRIGFKRPSREQLAMILDREVRKLDDGDTRWIAPTLDYCDEHGITDPRMVIALCLCGRDMLVTGEYQKMLADTEYTAA
jgi:ATPase family protein associated with various cellular activities (AAA)